MTAKGPNQLTGDDFVRMYREYFNDRFGTMFEVGKGLPRSRATDPATSHAAEATIEKSAKRIMGIILADLHDNGPAGFSKIARRTGLKDSQVWKRLSDLKNRKAIGDSGLTEVGDSGRRQTIWKARDGY